MRAVFSKEIKGYFNSIGAYTFAALLLFAGGASFAAAGAASGTKVLTESLGIMLFIAAPLLIMRLGYGKSGIDRALFSAPVSMFCVIAGKYFAALCVLAAALAVSLIYPVVIAAAGAVSWGEAASGYLGLLLLGAALISAGVFVASFAPGRKAAFMFTLALMLMLMLFHAIIPAISAGWLRQLLLKLSPIHHMDVFGSGILSFSSVVYFLSFILLSLIMAAGIIKLRRRA